MTPTHKASAHELLLCKHSTEMQYCNIQSNTVRDCFQYYTKIQYTLFCQYIITKQAHFPVKQASLLRKQLLSQRKMILQHNSHSYVLCAGA